MFSVYTCNANNYSEMKVKYFYFVIFYSFNIQLNLLSLELEVGFGRFKNPVNKDCLLAMLAGVSSNPIDA